MLDGKFGSHSLLAFFLLFAFIWIILFTAEPEFVKVDGMLSKMLCAWYSFTIAIIVALIVWIVSYSYAYMRTRRELGIVTDLFGYTSELAAKAETLPPPMVPVSMLSMAGGNVGVAPADITAAAKQSWADWFSALMRGTPVPDSLKGVAKTTAERIHQIENQPGMSASARAKLHALEAKIDSVTAARSTPDSARAEAASKFKKYLEQAQRERTADSRTPVL